MNLLPLGPARNNHTRFQVGQRAGHYESFYQRANHPTEPLAFWIRYTIFSPRGRPEAAIGELWVVVFDGTTNQHAVVKEEHPIADCAFDTRAFSVRIGSCTLADGRLRGSISGDTTVAWDLTYSGQQPPLYLLPRVLYSDALPTAKSLVESPGAIYQGQLLVGERTISIDGWVGSQNHNWGRAHTERYAFAQVAGFDDEPDSFLEVASVCAKTKPIEAPLMTFIVVRHRGRAYSLVSLRDAYKASSRFRCFAWEFTCEDDKVRLSGKITAPRSAFVGLNYYNPPGGSKHCLNTKIGACELEIFDKQSGQRTKLQTAQRALFELISDDKQHGVTIRA